MTALLLLIPAALALGGLGLLAFLWAVRSGQFDDLEGAAVRVLMDDDDTASVAADRQTKVTPAGEQDRHV